RELEISMARNHERLLSDFAAAVNSALSEGLIPIRFAVTRTTSGGYHCEIGVLEDRTAAASPQADSIFRFVRRTAEVSDTFNVVLLVPTGIGAEIGGHAGDAAPVARLLAEVCDTLITHPNVVNASDINEIPENSLYVEGSVICRLLM